MMKDRGDRHTSDVQLAAAHRPLNLTIDRDRKCLRINWADGHKSSFDLAWLRTACPCATCREERREAEANPLRLSTGPLPSSRVQDAELVGNYALRITWSDGHSNGIYGFSTLRAACTCGLCAQAHEQADITEASASD